MPGGLETAALLPGFTSKRSAAFRRGSGAACADRLVSIAARFDRRPAQIQGPAPRIGEHTAAILAEISANIRKPSVRLVRGYLPALRMAASYLAAGVRHRLLHYGPGLVGV